MSTRTFATRWSFLRTFVLHVVKSAAIETAQDLDVLQNPTSLPAYVYKALVHYLLKGFPIYFYVSSEPASVVILAFRDVHDF